MSNKDTLPPLPKDCIYAFSSGLPAAVMSAYYSGDQMRAYARAAIAAQAPTAPALCACKDRQASECPGEWEPGCDLGSNPKYAKAVPLPLPVQAEPANLAHEIWAAAQLVPEEGIEDGVARIQALLAPAAQDIAKFITGMCVSVDVSTGEDDSGNRYFGTVTEVMDCPDEKHGVTLLVQDAESNFVPAAQETPKLLTNGQIEPLVREFKRATFPPIASPELWFLRGIRAAEKAYGITGESE